MPLRQLSSFPFPPPWAWPKQQSSLHYQAARGIFTMIGVGDSLPGGVTFFVDPSSPREATAEELFRGKKVILIGIPGAFTPTCDQKHIPSFVREYDRVKAMGFDMVACVATNDIHVMGKFGQQQGANGKIEMLSDVSLEYTKACGLEMFAKIIGTRCRRHVLVLDDLKVVYVDAEEGGACTRSLASDVIDALKAKDM